MSGKIVISMMDGYIEHVIVSIGSSAVSFEVMMGSSDIEKNKRWSIERLLSTTTMAETQLVNSNLTFTSFSHLLDDRLLRALADMGFARPTLVQSKAIPLGLESRDILARARTGSGKTAAYCIPIVQKILNAKGVSISLYFWW